jgi:hypothetical protein
VTIRSRVPVTTASDRLQATDALRVTALADGTFEVRCEVLAGGLRIVELK